MAEKRTFKGFKKIDKSLVHLRKLIYQMGEGLTFPCEGVHTDFGDNQTKNYLFPNGKTINERYLE